jgi:hypothetical protein
MEPDTDHSVYCRTCRRALSVYTGPHGQVKLLHAVETRGQQVDHRPDPVPLSEMTDPIIECDFCGGTATVVYLVADQETRIDPTTRRVVGWGDYQRRHHAARTRRTETTPGITNVWGTRWTACPDCAAHVDAGDLYGLITRATESMPRKYTRGKRLPHMRGLLHNFYSGLFDNRPLRRGQITPEHPLGLWDDQPTTAPQHHGHDDRRGHEQPKEMP